MIIEIRVQALQMNGKLKQNFTQKARALNEISTLTPSHFHPLDSSTKEEEFLLNNFLLPFPPPPLKAVLFRREYLISSDSSLPFAIIHKIKKNVYGSAMKRPESLRHLTEVGWEEERVSSLLSEARNSLSEADIS
jgi:hypothetical protein